MVAVDVTLGLFVGVDSGGTRTNVHVEVRSLQEEPAIHSAYEVSESLSGALALELVPDALRTILAPLEREVGNAYSSTLPVHIWVSAAGYTSWTRNAYLAALEDVAPTLLGGRVRSAAAANDAVSLLLGSGAAGVVIAGTGSNVVVRGSDGDVRQSGGHEWVACDYGSGFWIGLRGIREAYRDYENGHSSVLLQRLLERYSVEQDDEAGLIETLRRLAIGDKDMKKEIARFAPDVCAAAERGDKAAQNLVKSEAEDLADVTAGALRRRFTRDQLAEGVRLVQCGSLLGNTFYRESYETQIEMRLLTGSEKKAVLSWDRRSTGAEAALSLARGLAADSSRYAELDPKFRPAVIEL